MPSLSHTRLVIAAALLLLAACGARADTLKITSNPSGATVEIDGLEVGITPFEQKYPGGYFHKTVTSTGARLGHPMIARVSLTGYTTKEITLTDGPMSWVSLKGQNHGQYWLLKADHFHVELDSMAATFTGGITTRLSAEAGPPLSIEDLVQRARPAVLLLKNTEGFGNGFFVTDTGVIVTNAHVARGEPKLLAVLANGQQLEAKVVYLDRDMDIALAKIEGQGMPHLALADATSVQQGESVVAIGNPGGGLPFSVTKGIVSAVGRFAVAGPGTWIQTDTPINPGNSGGPLLNLRGEVVGINTLKIVKEDVQSIGFALSASDLLEVLRRFYPGITAAAAPQAPQGSGSIEIASVPDAAEIWVDGKFVGNTPSTMKLSIGPHLILLKADGYADWQRQVEILKDSKATLTGTMSTAK